MWRSLARSSTARARSQLDDADFPAGVGLDDALEHLAHGVVEMIEARDRLEDLRRRREGGAHEEAALEPDVLEGGGVQRIAHRDPDRVPVLERDGDGEVALGQLFLDERDHALVDGDVLEIDDGKPELLMQHAADVALADEAVAGEYLSERLLGLLLAAERLLELGVGDHARVEQMLPELLPPSALAHTLPRIE
jgi:hypothetical protein